MYYPYFFSNQYEIETVFQLKSQIDEGLITPIIEPYKRSPVITTILSKIVQSGSRFIFIVNPYQKRTQPKDQEDISIYVQSFLEQKFKQIIFGIYINKDNIDFCNEFINNNSESQIAIFHRDIEDLDIKKVLILANSSNVSYNFFYGEATKYTYHKQFNVRGEKIVLEDPFKKQAKNSIYKEHADEKFYDLHSRYRELGYDGFGDYLTIGDTPSDLSSPNQPSTVVIHYTYPDGIEHENIRIKRFFGDLNKEYEKIGDAILKSMKEAESFINGHVSSDCQPCEACLEMVKKANEHKPYTMLGELKKFSMLHHINMIIKLTN